MGSEERGAGMRTFLLMAVISAVSMGLLAAGCATWRCCGGKGGPKCSKGQGTGACCHMPEKAEEE